MMNHQLPLVPRLKANSSRFNQVVYCNQLYQQQQLHRYNRLHYHQSSFSPSLCVQALKPAARQPSLKRQYRQHPNKSQTMTQPLSNQYVANLTTKWFNIIPTADVLVPMTSANQTRLMCSSSSSINSSDPSLSPGLMSGLKLLSENKHIEAFAALFSAAQNGDENAADKCVELLMVCECVVLVAAAAG